MSGGPLLERKPHQLIPALRRLDRHGNAKVAGTKIPNSETNALLCFAVTALCFSERSEVHV